MKRHKYGAKRTTCAQGHSHPSKREALRCWQLHALAQAGEITELVVEPTFTFTPGGVPITMQNGRLAQYRPDFTYIEKGKRVAEDVKGAEVTEAFRLRSALFRACFPEYELRITK